MIDDRFSPRGSAPPLIAFKDAWRMPNVKLSPAYVKTLGSSGWHLGSALNTLTLAKSQISQYSHLRCGVYHYSSPGGTGKTIGQGQPLTPDYPSIFFNSNGFYNRFS